MTRTLYTTCLLIFYCGLLCSQTSSITDLEKELSNASSTKDKMILNFDLSEAYLKTSNKKKAEDHAYKAALQARELGDDEMAARAYLNNARAKSKNRDRKGALTRLKNSFDYAKRSEDISLVLEVLEELVMLAKRNRDYKSAYNYTDEVLEMVKEEKSISSSSSTSRLSGKNRSKIIKENQQLAIEKNNLEMEIARLSREKNQLLTDTSNLTKKQRILEAEKSVIEAEKVMAEELVAKKEARIGKMNRKQLEAEVKLLDQENALAELNKQRMEQEIKLTEQDLALSESKFKLTVLFSAAALGVLLTLFFFLRYQSNLRSKKMLLEKNRIIQEERERSEDLLLNILPVAIAEELKEQGKARARRYENSTVMFIDFKNFTTISELLSPEHLVKELDHYFKGFDFIVSQYELEKIKTIGDAYMAASGLSDRRSIPTNVINAAIEIQEFLEDVKEDRRRKNRPYFEARIGIHTGPVVAGVVGINKFAYDIWGDTVNIAARMESNCEPGKINISEATYRLIKYNFSCQYRGKIQAKNKGQIDMYYVDGAMKKNGLAAATL